MATSKKTRAPEGLSFVANKRELVAALTRTSAVADKKSAMPSLTHVRLVADLRGIELAATDLTLGVTVRCKADVLCAGALTVSARHLLDVVKVLPDGDVTVSHQGNVVRVRNGKRHFDLAVLPAEDFPSIPSPEGVSFTMIPADDLADALSMASFSMSSDDTRPHLSGMLVELAGDTLRVVTTDGHRLTKVEREVSGMNGKATLLIPAKGVQELKRLVDELRAEKKDVAGPLTVGLGAATAEGPVFFRREGVTLSCKLVDAAFPHYANIIPTSSDRTLTVARAPFLDALRAMALVGSSVALAASSLRLALSAKGDGSDAGDELDAALLGPDVKMSFAVKYLTQALAVLDCEEVSLDCGEALDPTILRAVGRADFLHVVMPQRGDL